MISHLFLKKFNIEFLELTNNTIVLFDTKETLKEFLSEFENIINNNNYKEIQFLTNNKNTINIEKIINCRDITGIYTINNSQRFIFTVELISIFGIEQIEDLWFINKKKNKWICYAFNQYEGYENYRTKEQIYQFVCKSKYGLC